MFEITYVVATVVLLTEAIKRQLRRRWRKLDPAVPIIIAVALGAILNLGNAWLFSSAVTPEILRAALREGILAAGAAMGVWSGGKAYFAKVEGAKQAA